jgi:hypothetical protein
VTLLSRVWTCQQRRWHVLLRSGGIWCVLLVSWVCARVDQAGEVHDLKRDGDALKENQLATGITGTWGGGLIDLISGR